MVKELTKIILNILKIKENICDGAFVLKTQGLIQIKKFESILKVALKNIFWKNFNNVNENRSEKTVVKYILGRDVKTATSI